MTLFMRLASFTIWHAFGNNQYFIHAFGPQEIKLSAVEIVLRHKWKSCDGCFHGLVPHGDVHLVSGITVLRKL
jgi:hypothetical protein